ncbi:unnamed protein product [Danaus chrysippus]|uniref:(African queen) hypothetical protein n=1 Tax=Danaus chrysippus TaxID=151541 RepID=A0A8J2QW82_9NEOP|nr:unnamed protein product [Danaus chrysippus]
MPIANFLEEPPHLQGFYCLHHESRHDFTPWGVDSQGSTHQTKTYELKRA